MWRRTYPFRALSPEWSAPKDPWWVHLYCEDQHGGLMRGCGLIPLGRQPCRDIQIMFFETQVEIKVEDSSGRLNVSASLSSGSELA